MFLRSSGIILHSVKKNRRLLMFFNLLKNMTFWSFRIKYRFSTRNLTHLFFAVHHLDQLADICILWTMDALFGNNSGFDDSPADISSIQIKIKILKLNPVTPLHLATFFHEEN